MYGNDIYFNRYISTIYSFLTVTKCKQSDDIPLEQSSGLSQKKVTLECSNAEEIEGSLILKTLSLPLRRLKYLICLTGNFFHVLIYLIIQR